MAVAQIITQIHAFTKLCASNLQRKLVVLSGSEQWCHKVAKDCVTQDFLAVSQHAMYPCTTLHSPDSLHLLLGREYKNIVWNGFTGINPDGFGIASGLLKSGGVFLLLLPPFDELSARADPDYARMCSDTDEIAHCHTFFLQRLIKHVQAADDVMLFQENTPAQQFELVTPKQSTQSAQSIQLPTADQISAIAAIKKVAFGHRNRPLVIQAHRGRGKSSALGLAAAEIFLEKKAKIIITAPSKKTCEAAFAHYRAKILSCTFSQTTVNDALAAFEFVPIDKMLSESHSCHMLFIDEAAAIPSSSLSALFGKFSRVVYATTIHGYEGNGQGFQVRFKKSLDAHFPQWKSLVLKTPIRWLENDALEPWFFRFLLLDAQLKPVEAASLNTRQTVWLTQKQLFENETLFEQLISLLVTAHYQTSPSDIRLILDHPKIKILVTLNIADQDIKNATVLGVCLAIEEGSIDSPLVANDIIAGLRRPRGQLFPQALCTSSGHADFLTQSTYRVMRIAVHPTMQQQGLGSDLLKTLRVEAKKMKIDSLSTSYGLTSELLSFWTKNQFQVVKVGSKVDGSSGLRSIMMMHALSLNAQKRLHEHRQNFTASFIFRLNRLHQTLSAVLVCKILQSLSPLTFSLSTPSNTAYLKKITGFAKASRTLEETDIELFEFVLEKIGLPEWHRISEHEQEILVSQVLQNRDYKESLKHLKLTGRKQLLKAIRQAVSALLDTEA